MLSITVTQIAYVFSTLLTHLKYNGTVSLVFAGIFATLIVPAMLVTAAAAHQRAAMLKTQAALEAKASGLNRLISYVSHEARNPVSAAMLGADNATLDLEDAAMAIDRLRRRTAAHSVAATPPLRGQGGGSEVRARSRSGSLMAAPSNLQTAVEGLPQLPRQGVLRTESSATESAADAILSAASELASVRAGLASARDILSDTLGLQKVALAQTEAVAVEWRSLDDVMEPLRLMYGGEKPRQGGASHVSVRFAWDAGTLVQPGGGVADARPEVALSATSVGQVLTNFCSNAVKFATSRVDVEVTIAALPSGYTLPTAASRSAAALGGAAAAAASESRAASNPSRRQHRPQRSSAWEDIGSWVAPTAGRSAATQSAVMSKRTLTTVMDSHRPAATDGGSSMYPGEPASLLASSSLSQRMAGTGLGLAFCRAVASLMGGAVGHRDRLDGQQGSEFVMDESGATRSGSPTGGGDEPCSDPAELPADRQIDPVSSGQNRSARARNCKRSSAGASSQAVPNTASLGPRGSVADSATSMPGDPAFSGDSPSVPSATAVSVTASPWRSSGRQFAALPEEPSGESDAAVGDVLLPPGVAVLRSQGTSVAGETMAGSSVAGWGHSSQDMRTVLTGSAVALDAQGMAGGTLGGDERLSSNRTSKHEERAPSELAPDGACSRGQKATDGASMAGEGARSAKAASTEAGSGSPIPSGMASARSERARSSRAERDARRSRRRVERSGRIPNRHSSAGDGESSAAQSEASSVGEFSPSDASEAGLKSATGGVQGPAGAPSALQRLCRELATKFQRESRRHRRFFAGGSDPGVVGTVAEADGAAAESDEARSESTQSRPGRAGAGGSGLAVAARSPANGPSPPSAMPSGTPLPSSRATARGSDADVTPHFSLVVDAASITPHKGAMQGVSLRGSERSTNESADEAAAVEPAAGDGMGTPVAVGQGPPMAGSPPAERAQPSVVASASPRGFTPLAAALASKTPFASHGVAGSGAAGHAAGRKADPAASSSSNSRARGILADVGTVAPVTVPPRVVVFSDCNMPRMDGPGLVLAAASDPDVRALGRVFFVGVTGTPEDEKRFRDAGARIVISKPIGSSAVKAALHSALSAL
ncbi:hypothetical protein FNF29_04499 [Cafeteria roenbergensis]|uniref:histidine kinase n=1 Tax=Cafeteria roenbergensis TaxID=33653 RepID=A0A5A8CF25_CAFRO|nr:hypothetical protein FNF29_04499 [Cafeteria roenbergensis]|eukprot:KAA0151575.1 hypothetical protein FNF29_04499 [Cafeteria roenbergensis]